MGFAFIMRGLPGSGKSTVAKKLAGDEGVIHSTDNYFYENGVYVFKPELLQQYHDMNLEAFRESLCKKIPVVICDNTNIKKDHVLPYYTAADRAGYLVSVVAMSFTSPVMSFKRTTHKVPLYVIKRMAVDWEPW